MVEGFIPFLVIIIVKKLTSLSQLQFCFALSITLVLSNIIYFLTSTLAHPFAHTITEPNYRSYSTAASLASAVAGQLNKVYFLNEVFSISLPFILDNYLAEGLSRASANAGSRGGKREKYKATLEDEKTEDEKANCGSCGKEVLARQMEIKCEICNEWYYDKCQELTKTAYEAITTNKTVHWYCTGCNNGVVSRPTLQKMKKKQDQLEQGLNMVKFKVRVSRTTLGEGQIGRRAVQNES
jgi:hypothetical protein